MDWQRSPMSNCQTVTAATTEEFMDQTEGRITPKWWREVSLKKMTHVQPKLYFESEDNWE